MGEAVANIDRAWKARLTIFDKRPQTIKCTLPDGCRFVMFSRGEKPNLVPTERSGTYAISTEDFEDAPLPIAVCVVGLSDLPACLRLSVAKVDELIAQCEAATAPSMSSINRVGA